MTDIATRALEFLASQWGDQSDAAHDMGHIDRVRRLARRISREHGPVDAEALDVAAILHDLVNLPKDDPNRARASRLSAEAAAEWLQSIDWPPDRIGTVFHAIEAHSFSARVAPNSAEARCLQDADRLEALGAIGLARMFAVSGALGRMLFDPLDPLAHDRPLDDQRFALDHLETKLLRLQETMQTATGRSIAAERSAWLLQFRDRLLAELSGADGQI